MSTKSELIGEVLPRYLKNNNNLFTVAVYCTHINAFYVLLLLLTVPMYTMLSIVK